MDDKEPSVLCCQEGVRGFLGAPTINDKKSVFSDALS